MMYLVSLLVAHCVLDSMCEINFFLLDYCYSQCDINVILLLAVHINKNEPIVITMQCFCCHILDILYL